MKPLNEPSIAFLMYHELELPGRELCELESGYKRYVVPEAAFRTQMKWLRSRNCVGVSVSKALEFSAADQAAITFDDGCETDLITAAPILAEVGFGATFYVTTGFLGLRGYMTQHQVRQLKAAGFEIGCHSMTHPYLNDLRSAEQQREIAGSKNQLEQILGCRVDHFSCPGGRFNHRVIEVVKEAGYTTLATSHPRLNAVTTDHFCLGRIAVLRNTNLKQFTGMCDGRGLWTMTLGQNIRGAAKRLLGNQLYDRMRQALLLEPDSR